ncbi:hypothetical protein LEP1GSC103_0593 [Leptospira borgpetersenii serovar Javanica str. UI 09931]|uniref:Uncharacterized protein n=4 Tax=Leptospira borgpetersenii TaxID=174 RepID=M3HSV3_LEPBO|nr:hypothetical protein LEP1GSC128_1260 [Leptospira borgpetersenii str. 200801926]EKQ90529.1 hypothetical protein LEP1GSC101_0509 [Leptospira borgpetersenii str. UI 09149]EMG01141.1 hypothetical protein LEP1GSC123_1030 [Leptospira borgpetersenii str. 200701203]EMK13784.1 hypothetical protein LEP1GSC066_0772 [Leptospira sp. serovar Kenya str. Sh9]EMN14749.1 hypothetical protein LEP1GSC055_2802 [Leptospira borgpetersenii str. Brem 307]EMN15901.1 hypothetical protein LEP1GSC056_3752 [Leptospira b
MSPKNVGVRRSFSLLNNPDTNEEDFGKDSDFNRKTVENMTSEKSKILFLL